MRTEQTYNMALLMQLLNFGCDDNPLLLLEQSALSTATNSCNDEYLTKVTAVRHKLVTQQSYKPEERYQRFSSTWLKTVVLFSRVLTSSSRTFLTSFRSGETVTITTTIRTRKDHIMNDSHQVLTASPPLLRICGSTYQVTLFKCAQGWNESAGVQTRTAI